MSHVDRMSLGGHSPVNHGKVREQIFDEKVREKSWKFMKNCQSR